MSDSAEQRFAGLVQPHFAALYRAACVSRRRHADAEDLVQEVCLRACSKLEELGRGRPIGARGSSGALYHLFVDTWAPPVGACAS